MNKKRIGIVGGMGSYAGLDLLRKIYDATPATSDSEHFPVTLISAPQQTTDRTQFLIGQSTENPSVGMLQILERLAEQQATLIGIPCNTAHAKPILDEVMKNLPAGVTLVHMIESVTDYISDLYPEMKKVGILGTTGTIDTNVYRDSLAQRGIEALHPDETVQQDYVMNAIYHPQYGIKAQSNPVSKQARLQLLTAADRLFERGAQLIVLGCTEIPLAITQAAYKGYPLIDATLVLAKRLVKQASYR